MAKGKCKWMCKAKELRRSNKMWAEGAHEDLLKKHIETYTDALEQGHCAEHDCWQKICTEYHTLISWRLADHEEPELPLPEYDPFTPPLVEDLMEEERVQRHAQREECHCIRRWLKYCTQSLRRKSTLKTDIRNNLYAVLLGQLSSIKNTSKARQAYQQFMHESAPEVAKAVDECWAENWIKPDGSTNTKGPDVHFRAKVVRELFAEMSEDEKEGYHTRAAAEATAAKEAYKSALEKGPSKDLASRQRCINQFGKFMGPIMKGVQEYTGLQGFVVLGGPMPKYNREVGTLHLTVRHNQAAVPTTFPGYDGRQWDALIDAYTKYLGTAYSSQDCAEAVLPSEGSLNDTPCSFNDNEFDVDSDDTTDSSSNSDSSSELDEEARGKRKEQKVEVARKRKEAKKAGNGKKRKADTQSGSSDRAAKKMKTKAGSAKEETREKEETCEGGGRGSREAVSA
ncbi:hypothetical protein B0H14DRAFT_2624173 [Mycena olivaceomarginata]|nr:hypothetical protein B0H14DRAFT_2624173 [Mycena olivaceomarginata]